MQITDIEEYIVVHLILAGFEVGAAEGTKPKIIKINCPLVEFENLCEAFGKAGVVLYRPQSEE